MEIETGSRFGSTGAAAHATGIFHLDRPLAETPPPWSLASKLPALAVRHAGNTLPTLMSERINHNGMLACLVPHPTSQGTALGFRTDERFFNSLRRSR
jgi:hypothetical protein